MKILADELKPLFVKAAIAAFPGLSTARLLELCVLEDPRDPSHGDYACPIAFRLAKEMGKNPAAIAREIVKHFPKDGRVGAVQFAQPGYVNLRLKNSHLEELIKELEDGFHVEKVATREAGHRLQPMVVEYSSTNAAKPMAAHHLITTFLGDALSNLLEFMGYNVIRVNHLGDWGTHFGKIIYAVEKWGDRREIEKNPNEEFMRLYVKFNEEAEKNPDLEDEARKIFKALEEGDELRISMWEWIVAESMKDVEKQFARLGIHFNHILGESFYRKMAEEVIMEGLNKDLFKEGEGGALIFDMGEGQVPAMIRKGDGTTLYLSRDVATVKYRVETWHPQAILYVVDHAQSLHFSQDFAIAKAMGYTRTPGADSAESEEVSLEHISFGRMRFKDAKMSTRKGNVVVLEQVLDEATKRAAKLAGEKGTELPRGELKELAELVGVASVKYGILAQDRNRDILFDWEKIITLEGNSAPYLLYSYARAHSIFEKVGRLNLTGLPKFTNEHELDLARLLVKFPEVLERASYERKPHMVATFLYELCQRFNRFYGTTSVLNASSDEEKRSRLGLVQAFMHELKTGLSILGIPVLEKM